MTDASATTHSNPAILELRTAYLRNGADSQRARMQDFIETFAHKVKMFADGEMALFRRLGMLPVFFGTTLIGRRMPNLVYMLGYESLTHRQKVWEAFLMDPEWIKMRDTPGNSDAEIVSNISSVMLSPLSCSQVK